MPDVKTFYPGATAGNPINNPTDAAGSAVATTVDDHNQTANSKSGTGTAAQCAALGSKDAEILYDVTA